MPGTLAYLPIEDRGEPRFPSRRRTIRGSVSCGRGRGEVVGAEQVRSNQDKFGEKATMIRLLGIFILVFGLAACASDQSTKNSGLGVSNAYKEGTIFNDIFKIDFAAGKKSVPLPPGDWKLVSKWEYRTDVSNITIIHFYLVRHDENKVSGIVTIETNKEFVDFGWVLSNICSEKRKEIAWYVYEDSYDLHEDCNIVYPFRRFNRNYKPLEGTFDYIDSNKLEMPSQWIRIWFVRSQDAEKLQVSYALPPENYGFPRQSVHRRSRDWSFSRFQADPEKAAFMEKVKAWAKSWKGLIDKGFKNELRKEDVTAHPHIAETGSKQQVMTAIAPSRLSRGEISKLLVGNTEYGKVVVPSRSDVEGLSGTSYVAFYSEYGWMSYKNFSDNRSQIFFWYITDDGVLCRGPGQLDFCQIIERIEYLDKQETGKPYQGVGFPSGNIRYRFSVRPGNPENLR